MNVNSIFLKNLQWGTSSSNVSFSHKVLPSFKRDALQKIRNRSEWSHIEKATSKYMNLTKAIPLRMNSKIVSLIFS